MKSMNEDGEMVATSHWNDPFYGLFFACSAVFVILFFIPANIINIDQVQQKMDETILKADKELEKSRKDIEKLLDNDKSKVKDAIPPNVRKSLGFDY